MVMNVKYYPRKEHNLGLGFMSVFLSGTSINHPEGHSSTVATPPANPSACWSSAYIHLISAQTKLHEPYASRVAIDMQNFVYCYLPFCKIAITVIHNGITDNNPWRM